VYTGRERPWVVVQGCRLDRQTAQRVTRSLVRQLVSENRCMQGSFLKRMHARVVLGTNACNQKGHFDGCTQRTFGQQMCARYGAIPRCTLPLESKKPQKQNQELVLVQLLAQHAKGQQPKTHSNSHHQNHSPQARYDTTPLEMFAASEVQCLPVSPRMNHPQEHLPFQYHLYRSHHFNPSEVAQDCAQTDEKRWRSQKQ